jgi:hypothetical protein
LRNEAAPTPYLKASAITRHVRCDPPRLINGLLTRIPDFRLCNLLCPNLETVSDYKGANSRGVEKSVPVEFSIEADINSLIQEEIPKRSLLEAQTPKRIQIEDDAERSTSLVARITSNSIVELGELASDLSSALQNLQEFLKSEGERVQREIVDYAHLNRTAVAAIKTIIETASAPCDLLTVGVADNETVGAYFGGLPRREASRYSSTSSAVASSEGWTAMPSSFAVLRLMTVSKLVGCSTGISAAFAPFKIRSTSSAPRCHRVP